MYVIKEFVILKRNSALFIMIIGTFYYSSLGIIQGSKKCDVLPSVINSHKNKTDDLLLVLFILNRLKKLLVYMKHFL